MEEEIDKEIAILSLLRKVNELLGNNQNLADSVSEKLDLLPEGAKMRGMLINKRRDQSYYKESYAKLLYPVLDSMIEHHRDVDFKLINNPGVSLRTLYLRVYQSWLWIMDNTNDPKYRKLYEESKISQIKDVGVRIKYRGEPDSMNHEILTEKPDNLLAIQAKIDAFLAQDITKDTLFDSDGEGALSLSEEQITRIQEGLAGIPNLTVRIESSRIRIMRKFIV